MSFPHWLGPHLTVLVYLLVLKESERKKKKKQKSITLFTQVVSLQLALSINKGFIGWAVLKYLHKSLTTWKRKKDLMLIAFDRKD